MVTAVEQTPCAWKFITACGGCQNSGEQEDLISKLEKNVQNSTGLWSHIQPAELLRYD